MPIKSIKPLAPKVCPQCNAKNPFIIGDGKFTCEQCFYTMRETDVAPQSPPAQLTSRRDNLRASYRITTRGEIDTWARAAFDTAQDFVRQKKWDDALKSFYRAIENQPDFIDPHLWIARISEDPTVQEEHLTTVLAHNPNHLEALQELMVLRGELDPSALDAKDPHAPVVIQDAGGKVTTITQNLRCSQCGSPDMKYDFATHFATCNSCGNVDKNVGAGGGSMDSLTMALLKRRSQKVIWKVGERMLHCNGCGAERTIPAKKLSDNCPFCGSKHVILQDSLNTFEQPNGMVRFMVSKKQASEAVKSKLSTWMERMKGWLDNNTVERATLQGIYLPFWVFDATLDVRRTAILENPGVGMSNKSRETQNIPAYNSMVIQDGMNNVFVPAVKSPPKRMIHQLGKFDLGQVVDYNPQLLSEFTAELYSIDFDKASLDARTLIGKVMRERHTNNNPSGVSVNVFTSVTQMSFRLLLLPVWVATLYEEDGDVRTALVNGQTGQVVMGKARKPR